MEQDERMAQDANSVQEPEATTAEEARVPARELAVVLEALLFAAGDPLELEQLAELTGYDAAQLEALLEQMRSEPGDGQERRGIELRRVGSRYTLATRPDYNDYVARLYEPRHRPRLTQAAYEVLAIIAYNQPVTRAQIEFVRGVNSDSIISRLEERGYIAVTGQLDSPGRPSLFSTTERFLLETGLAGPEDLPPMEMLMYDSLQAFEHELEHAEAETRDEDETGLE